MIVYIILNSTGEIKKELAEFYDDRLSREDFRIDSLTKTILRDPTRSANFIQALPEYAIKLAWRFWVIQDDEEDQYNRHLDIAQLFGISCDMDSEYEPSSAFQTPIFLLLRYHRIRALDFIIKFVNYSINYYSQSDRNDVMRQIVISFKNEPQQTQYASCALWMMYRPQSGTTSILESIHMALEKWLLQIGEKCPEDLESICLDLLKKSESASITAVVMSIVLAFPDSLFDVAAILMRTRELFSFDSRRWSADHLLRSTCFIGYGLEPSKKHFEDERIRTLDDPFRAQRFENIILKYQLGTSKGQEEITRRKRIIWGILDEYYRVLPCEENQTNVHSDWRLNLARMDIRKMELQIEDDGKGNSLIKFNPEIDDNLKRYSEESQLHVTELTRYLPVKSWSLARYKNDNSSYSQYVTYETDPQQAFSEMMSIMEELDDTILPKDQELHFLYNSTPAYICAVLLRDFHPTLGAETFEICSNTVFQYADILVSGVLNYQIPEFTEPTITSLCLFIGKEPIITHKAKSYLLRLLFNMFELRRVARFQIGYELWVTSPIDAQSLLFGYLSLIPGYRDYIRNKRRMKDSPEGSWLDEYMVTKSSVLQRVMDNSIPFPKVEMEHVSPEDLVSACLILPNAKLSENLKLLLKFTIEKATYSMDDFSPRRSRQSNNDREDPPIRNIHSFLDKFSSLLFYMGPSEIKEILQPIKVIQSPSQEFKDFLRSVINTSNRLNSPDTFWIIWNEFFEPIRVIMNGKNHYIERTIVRYIALDVFEPDVREWHSLRPEDIGFFDRVVSEMGSHPITLYSVAYVLNSIASPYWRQGIRWLSDLITNNTYQEIPDNTDYFIEQFMTRCITRERMAIRKGNHLRNQALHVLDYLVQLGSSQGFQLREDIL